VFPPLPPGVAELSYANNFKWKTSKGEDRYRRGMYTFFKRTSPHPTLTSFDCPDSNTTKLQRDVSNTPLQALATLNNDVFLESAQAFAGRILQQAGDTRSRMTFALRSCIYRQPSSELLDEFVSLLNDAQAYYSEHPEDAEELLSRHQVKNVDAAENAAWVATARMILNLDEFIVRD
jgi:cell division septum initiation protein DivIVA